MLKVGIPEHVQKRLQTGHETLLVVGGGGWIGRALLDVLAGALTRPAFEERVRVLGSSTREITVAPEWTVPCLELGRWRDLSPAPALVFHNAFLTREKASQMPAQVYIDTNRRISDDVADLCAAWRPQGLFLPSSGAAYGKDGALETDMEHNPYGKLKVEDENRFRDLMRRNGSYVAARIFGLSGEYINKTDSYALANLIVQLKSTGEMSLRARGEVYRSYVYVGDLLALTLELMGDPDRSETFDTAMSEVVEIGELANRVRRVLGRPDAAIRRREEAGVAVDRYVGDPAALERLASEVRTPFRALDEQIARTAAYLDDTGA